MVVGDFDREHNDLAVKIDPTPSCPRPIYGMSTAPFSADSCPWASRTTTRTM
jgi:hypothetical protein